MKNRHILDDLIGHATDQANDAIRRAADLLDDERQRNLVVIGTIARIVGQLSRELIPTPVRESEAVLITAMILCRALVADDDGMPRLSHEELEKRARTLAHMLVGDIPFPAKTKKRTP